MRLRTASSNLYPTIVCGVRCVGKVTRGITLMATFTLTVIAVHLGQVAFAEAQDSFSFKASKKVTREFVTKLYEDKTWDWGDGAGYFGTGGKFIAYSGDGDKASYGKGRWEVSRSGILCFYSRWYAKSGSAPASKCFQHRLFDGDIYQLASKSKNWYLFKHRQTLSSDEFSKFKDGNLIATKVAEIEAEIDKTRAKKAKKRSKRRKRR